MRLVASSDSCEAGSELVLKLEEMPAKMKAPTWEVKAAVTGDDGVLTEVAANVLPVADADGTWTLTLLLPDAFGVLVADITLVDGKTNERASVSVVVVPKPSPQQVFERALAGGRLDEVRKLLGADDYMPPSEDVALEGDAPEPADKTATPPSPLARGLTLLALPAESGVEYEWEDSSTGDALLGVLASLEAEEEEKLPLLQTMVAHGAYLPERPVHRSNRPSALHWAVARRQPMLLEELLKLGTAHNLADQAASPLSARVGFTPLAVACEIGDASAAARLVDAGSPVGGPRGSPTPLALCIRRGDEAMTRSLVGRGGAALLRLGTHDVLYSALALANAAADEKPPSAEPDPLVSFLLAQPEAVAALGYSVGGGDPGSEALVTASAIGLHHVVERLLQRGVPPAPLHPDRRSALHDAVGRGHVKTSRLLLAAKADPNAFAVSEAPARQTPLLLATSVPDERVARELVWVLRSHGANVGLPATDGSRAEDVVAKHRPGAAALLADLRAPLAKMPLPPGWEEGYDAQLRRPFYFNPRTRARAWEAPLPEGAFAAAA